MKHITIMLLLMLINTPTQAQGWINFSEIDIEGKIYVLFEDSSNHDLYACGHLVKIGNQINTGVARWDGQAWNQVGNDSTYPKPTMLDIERFDDTLYFGGMRGLYRLVEGEWEQISPQSVTSLCVHDDTLFVVGRFHEFQGLKATSVAGYSNGEWFIPTLLDSVNTIRGSVIFQNKLVIAVSKSPQVLSGTNTCLYTLEGDLWKPLHASAELDSCTAWALALDGNDLYVSVSGPNEFGNIQNRIARLRNDEWTYLEGTFDHIVEWLYFWDDKIHASGRFEWIDSTLWASGYAFWDGQEWCTTQERITWESGHALGSYQGNLIKGVSGAFATYEGENLGWANGLVVLDSSDTKPYACVSSVEPLSNDQETLANRASELRLFPNPTTGLAKLEWIAESEAYSIQILNSLGKVIFQKNIECYSGERVAESMDISFIPDGIYVLHLSSSTGSVTKRFIKRASRI